MLGWHIFKKKIASIVIMMLQPHQSDCHLLHSAGPYIAVFRGYIQSIESHDLIMK
jgi:hypothetical protein